MSQFEFEQTLFSYLENLKHQLNFRPLTLGGVSGENGGNSGPPGGFVGQLPQSKVAYDTVEASTIYTISGVPNSTRTQYPGYVDWQHQRVMYFPQESVSEFTLTYAIPGNTNLNTFWHGESMQTTPTISGITAGIWEFTTNWEIAIPASGIGLPSNWKMDIHMTVQRYVYSGAYWDGLVYHTDIRDLFTTELGSITFPAGTSRASTSTSVVQPAFHLDNGDWLIFNYTSNVVNPYGGVISLRQVFGGGTTNSWKIRLPSNLNILNQPDTQQIVGNSLVDNLNHIRGRISLLEENKHQAVFSFEGTAIAGEHPTRLYNFVSRRNITGVFVSSSIPPSGTSLIADIHKNGTTIFPDQSIRPTISGGQYYGQSNTIPSDTKIWDIGDYITASLDQVGSITPGSYPVVYVVYK